MISSLELDIGLIENNVNISLGERYFRISTSLTRLYFYWNKSLILSRLPSMDISFNEFSLMSQTVKTPADNKCCVFLKLISEAMIWVADFGVRVLTTVQLVLRKLCIILSLTKQRTCKFILCLCLQHAEFERVKNPLNRFPNALFVFFASVSICVKQL